MEFDADNVTAVASVFGCFSLVLLVLQVASEHDRSRREKALDVIRGWDDVLTVNTFRYVALLSKLGEDAVVDIYAGRSVRVSRDIARQCLPELAEQTQDDVLLSVERALEVRFTIITFLNSLESVALAYKHGVADRDVLAEAFQSFFAERKILQSCSRFMNLFGKSWPSIADVADEIGSRRVTLRPYPDRLFGRFIQLLRLR